LQLAAVVAHQHVARLEVAMHDAFLVRVLHRPAHLTHQQDAVLQGQLLLLAELVEWYTLHQLHREVRLPAFRRAAVVDLGDALVVHHRQRLALLLEAGDDGLAVHAELDELQRHASLHRLQLLRAVDRAHAAFSEAVVDPVRSDLVRARVRRCVSTPTFIRESHGGGVLPELRIADHAWVRWQDPQRGGKARRGPSKNRCRAQFPPNGANHPTNRILEMTMKLFALPVLFAAALAAHLPAAAPVATTPVVAEAAVEVLEPAVGGWRSFATSFEAHRFARLMASRGYWTNVFYDPYACWWVCEFN
jgi:hypothetical protein